VPAKDDRPKLWEIAQARARTAAHATRLMGVLCWLYYKREVHDLPALNRVAVRISRARNPYPYFQTGGKALESILGELAVKRNELEHSAEEQANLDFLAGR